MKPAWTEDFIGTPCEHPGFLFDRDRIAVEESCSRTAVCRYGFATLEPETGEIGLMMIGVCKDGKHHVYKAEQHWLSDYVVDGIHTADIALAKMQIEAWNTSGYNRGHNPNKGSIRSWRCNVAYAKTKLVKANSVFREYVSRRAHEWDEDYRPYLNWEKDAFSLIKSQAEAAPLLSRINSQAIVLYEDTPAYRELKRQLLDFPDIAGGALIEGLMASSGFGGQMQTPNNEGSDTAAERRKGTWQSA
ncbi:MAG: hypothetical protein AAF423_14190 [Pseudomonadota bacterium]